MTITVFKDHAGSWKACESHELGRNKEGRMLVLDITTYKAGSGSFYTTASVYHRDGGWSEHTVHVDYWNRIGIAKFRGTSKAVAEHHAFCVKDAGLDNLIAAARCHHREDFA